MRMPLISVIPTGWVHIYILIHINFASMHTYCLNYMWCGVGTPANDATGSCITPVYTYL